MSSHDLDDKRPLVRESGCVDVVDRLADALERAVAPDSRVGAAQIIINGSDQSDNVEMPVRLDLLFCPFPCGHQLVHETGPFCSELVGAYKRAISTTDDEHINALLDHVIGGY